MSVVGGAMAQQQDGRGDQLVSHNVLPAVQANSGAQGKAEISVPDNRPLRHYEYVFDLVTSIGTLVVAFLALFGERLRNWLARPKLTIDLERSSPYVGDVESEPATSASGSEAARKRVIRARIINSGRLPARAFSLQIDCVYRLRDGGTDFYKDSLLPRPIPLKEVPLEDARTRMDLIPNFPFFIEIAEIRAPEVLTQAGQGVPNVPSPEVFLRIPHGAKGEFYRAGTKKIIFPVILHSESLREASRHYIEIFWNGDDVSNLCESNFSVRILEEDKVRQVVGDL